jgi:hypothetical protein
MDESKKPHRYLFSYTANASAGAFWGHATITLRAPFSPENLSDVCKVIQDSAPQPITSPTIISVWKFED